MLFLLQTKGNYDDKYKVKHSPWVTAEISHRLNVKLFLPNEPFVLPGHALHWEVRRADALRYLEQQLTAQHTVGAANVTKSVE